MTNFSMTSGSKDERYYFPNGNITILVSEILFKVHRHILARDGSTFENMFSLDVHAEANTPTNGSIIFQQDGGSDENPIQLQGDTVDEFRDLLWCLYALPQEIAVAMSPEGDIVKLSNVARMAHKYHFITTEAWAIRTIVTQLQAKPPPPLLTHTLIQVTEAAVLCSDHPLLDAVRQKWKGLIGERKDLAVAIGVTERFGMRDLQGLAYLAMLLQGRDIWDSEPLLTRDHRIRLLSGYHNLTKFCDALPKTPPDFDHNLSCGRSTDCVEKWTLFWEHITILDPEQGLGSQTLVHDKLDLVGRLMMAVSVVIALNQGERIGGFLATGCTGFALQATTVLCRKMQEGMMDFFQDVV
ncbi:hypothetical protein BDZ97DRAFT_1920104 [Flammula alnicola]|nr:hypothetical protein BDZ97DRAFT_1920104 [Flammula alnicola]